MEKVEANIERLKTVWDYFKRMCSSFLICFLRQEMNLPDRSQSPSWQLGGSGPGAHSLLPKSLADTVGFLGHRAVGRTLRACALHTTSSRKSAASPSLTVGPWAAASSPQQASFWDQGFHHIDKHLPPSLPGGPSPSPPGRLACVCRTRRAVSENYTQGAGSKVMET